jgi:hypothetical protein
MEIQLEAMAVAMPEVADHPNRLLFRGVLTLVGMASQRPPSGANGHRVMLTRQATDAALPSLLGMALDYTPTMDAHDARRKIGIITEAEVVPLHVSGVIGQLAVGGYLFAHDFPDVVKEIRGSADGQLGMSYEIANVRVPNPASPVWTATDFMFTGAAVLRRDKAAYPQTWIALEGRGHSPVVGGQPHASVACDALEDVKSGSLAGSFAVRR